MAKYKQGILGPFKGTVGTVVGSSWKEIDYMRGRSGPNSSSTPAQKVSRERFKIVAEFLSPMRLVLNTCYTDFAGIMRGTDSAHSYIVKNAIRGEYPHQFIDYSLVPVTRGSLPNADAINVETITGPGIRFTWANNTGQGIAGDTDKAVLVAYCKELNQTLFTTEGASRKAETGTLLVPVFSGKSVHVWLGFTSRNGKEVSSSFYTGELMIP